MQLPLVFNVQNIYIKVVDSGRAPVSRSSPLLPLSSGLPEPPAISLSNPLPITTLPVSSNGFSPSLETGWDIFSSRYSTWQLLPPWPMGLVAPMELKLRRVRKLKSWLTKRRIITRRTRGHWRRRKRRKTQGRKLPQMGVPSQPLKFRHLVEIRISRLLVMVAVQKVEMWLLVEAPSQMLLYLQSSPSVHPPQW